MIKRYTDHSANERTYLAWIRTAITIMAFGFPIEKFDLFSVKRPNLILSGLMVLLAVFLFAYVGQQLLSHWLHG